MEGLPLVSIVTPSFNQGRFLRRTIESVLGQGYPRIEYIVCDGGSTDGSREILGSYGDRLRWDSQPDAGQSAALNRGFAGAHGEVFAYLNSDDLLRPGAVEAVVQHLARNAECDLVYGDADYVDEEDRVIGAYPTAEYSFSRLAEENVVCQPAAFWRSRVAGRVGPFNEALRYAMDYEYWLRLARAGGRLEHLPRILAATRLHPGAKTLAERRDVLREIFAVCETQLGRVGRTYFIGLWHDRMAAGPGRWLGPPARWRRLYQAVGYLHHKWYHRGRRAQRGLGAGSAP
ncbi:MAG: glycosyltransferase [Acidobacteria bacterium]|nr:MAG: glycosyltransferase [Acidobacteriota bacterium]